MGRVKEWAAEEHLKEIDRRIAAREYDFIYLFTNKEARPIDSNSDGFFQAYGGFDGYEEIIHLGSVNLRTKLCKCDECKKASEPDFAEQVSARTALLWLKGEFGSAFPIWLWVSSKEILDAEADEFPRKFSGKCAFRRRIVTDLNRLLDKLTVWVDEYCYENRHLIPFFVEGSKATTTLEV